MAQGAWRPCNQMGCAQLVKRGYCALHRKLRYQRENAARRANPERAALDREYWTTRWKRARAAWLAEHPLCMECECGGRVTAAVEVDHIVPTAEGGAMYDSDNWQSLCEPHHRAKSGRELARRRAGMGVVQKDGCL